MNNNPKKVFHAISYLQYPLMLSALIYYVPFTISLFNKSPDWSLLNNVLILFGIGMSFSTLQDTTTTQNKFSKKIWQHPTKGKVMITVIAFMSFALIVIGMLALFLFNVDQTESVAVGITVLGIGMLGILKAALEMFENHRLDRR